MELVESVDDLKSSRSNKRTHGPNFELLDAREKNIEKDREREKTKEDEIRRDKTRRREKTRENENKREKKREKEREERKRERERAREKERKGDGGCVTSGRISWSSGNGCAPHGHHQI